MIKEDYIKYKKLEEVPMELFYEYYKEFKSDPIPLEEFKVSLPKFLIQFQGQVLMINGKMKIIDFPRILEKIYSHFNNKYEGQVTEGVEREVLPTDN